MLGVGLPRNFSLRRARRCVVCDSRRVTVEKMRKRKPLWRGPDTMSRNVSSVSVVMDVLN